MIPSLIVFAVSFFMVCLTYWPVSVAAFYLLVRPLIQPYAYLQYTFAGSFPLTGLTALALVLVATYTCLFRRNYTIMAPGSVPLYGLLFFSLLSVPYSINFSVSLAHVLKVATAIALYLLVYSGVKTKAQLSLVLEAMVASAIIPILVGYYQFATGTGHAWKSIYYASSRPDSLFGEWNIYGEFLALSLVATLMAISIPSGRVRKAYHSFLLVGIVSSIIISLNRGTWLALIVGLLATSAVHWRRVQLRWVVIGLLAVGLFAGPVIVQRFAELNEVSEYGYKNTLLQRVQGWEQLLPLMLERPVVGYGIGVSPQLTLLRFGEEWVPHNDYLRLSLEAGFPAAVAYIWFLLVELYAFAASGRRERNGPVGYYMLWAVIYFLVISATQNIVYDVIIFPMMMALLAVGHKWPELQEEPADKVVPRRQRVIFLGTGA